MDLITNNPYRIAGIYANASAREMQRVKGKFSAFVNIGRSPVSDLDFSVLANIDRTEESLNTAYANIQQSTDKVIHSLFWFINANTFDKTALAYLEKGETEKAKEIWEKVTDNRDITSKNYSSFNNLATLSLVGNKKSNLSKGIKLKLELLESIGFKKLQADVGGETCNINLQEITYKFIDTTLINLKAHYNTKDIISIFKPCKITTRKHVAKHFAEEPIYSIEAKIKKTKELRKENKNSGYINGKMLYENTEGDLALLKTLLGEDDLKYKTLADQMANEIMQCAIDYFNESQDNDSDTDYLKFAMKLTKLAQNIAVGQMARDRARDSLQTLEEMKDRELGRIILFLASVKEAYEESKQEILQQVRQLEANLEFGRTINQTKVREAIQNSINWDAVVDGILENLPSQKMTKITKSTNNTKINEYKELVEFVLEKLSPSQRRQVGYLQYWAGKPKPRTSTETERPTRPPQPTVYNKDEEFSFTENAWWILGIAGVFLGLVFGLEGGCVGTGILGAIIGGAISENN